MTSHDLLRRVPGFDVYEMKPSLLYGANAFAGVVSITTVSYRPTEGDVLISVGEQGQRRISGRFRGNWPVGDGQLDLGASVGTLGRYSPSDPQHEVLDVPLRGRAYLRYRLGRRLVLSLHGGVTLVKGTILMWQIYHTRYETHLYYRSNVSALGVWLANADPPGVLPPALDNVSCTD